MNSKKLMAGFSHITNYAQKLSEGTDFVRPTISTQKASDPKDSLIKMLKGELMKTKNLLSCSDRNRAVLQQRLDDTKQRCSSLQYSYESLVKQHQDLQLAHQELAAKSLVLAKQWQLLRDQKAQAAPMWRQPQLHRRIMSWDNYHWLSSLKGYSGWNSRLLMIVLFNNDRFLLWGFANRSLINCT